jgi:hypothetical protein
MTHDVYFVTAVYDNLSTTLFSGRHNRGTHYAFSLAQIHDMGVPIYCFTDKVNLYRYFTALLRFGHENFKFISYNLEDSPYFEKIQAVKKAHPELYINNLSWSTRCVEIMWGKFDWLAHVIEKIGIKEDRYIYWIDAGLSHPGVIPKRFNTKKATIATLNNASHSYSYDFCNNLIFNKDFPDFLVEFTGKGKLFHSFCTNRQHNDVSHLPPSNKFQGTAVGGLFGGDIALVYRLVQEAKNVCEDLLDHGFIIKEEDILTHLLNKESNLDPAFEEKITLYKFNTWYHEDWTGAFQPGKLKSFSELFDEFLAYQKLKK